MFFCKGPSWNCERRLYSTASDQPDVGPINMHEFIAMAEAIKIIKESSITRMMVCIVSYRFLIVALYKFLAASCWKGNTDCCSCQVSSCHLSGAYLHTTTPIRTAGYSPWKEMVTKLSIALQVTPPWLWSRYICIDGQFWGLRILTTKKGWMKSILELVLFSLIGTLFICVG
jgi:hypothetical protein